MINQLKTNLNYLKFLILLCFVLSFTNCEKDDNFNLTKVDNFKSQEKFNVKKINAGEIEQNNILKNKFSSFNKISNKKDNQINKIIDADQYNFSINTSYGVFLEDPNSLYHSYTFEVIRNQEIELIENIVFSLQSDMTYKTYIVTYNVNSYEKNKILSGEQVNLDNKITMFEIDNFFDILDITGKASADTMCLGYEWQDGNACPYEGHTTTNMYNDNGTLCQWLQEGNELHAGSNVVVSIPCPGDNGGNNNTTNTTTTSTTTTNNGGTDNTTTNNDTVATTPVGSQSAINIIIEENTCATEGEVNNLLIKLGLSSNNSLKNCFMEPEMCASVRALNNYIFSQTPKTPEYVSALSFSKAAAEAICNGGEVDYEDKIIKDGSFIGTKADCVYELLKSTNNNLFKEVMSAFANGNPKYLLKFQVGGLLYNQNEAETSYNTTSGFITIKINPDHTLKSSLEIASTILHEGIHAELRRIILTGNNGINPLPTAQYNYLLSLYEFYFLNGSAAMVSNNATHLYMVHNHVDLITQAIRKLDNNLYPLENYYWYGWDGLEDIGMDTTNPQLITQLQFNNYTSLKNIPENDSNQQICDN